jgi:hypothetical protein
MWELLAGRFFAEAGAADVEARLNRGQSAPRVSTVVKDVPPELDELIALCLETDRDHRYASARELGRALERCGVELFDEGRMAEFLQEQLPETRTALRRLVALAEQPEPNSEAIKAELKALRKADVRTPARSPPAPAPSAVIHPSSPPTIKMPDRQERRFEPIIPPSNDRPTQSLPPQLPINRFAIAAVALVAVLGGLYWFWPREEALGSQRPKGEELNQMWRARTALTQGDPLEARALAVNCRTPRGPCPGVDTLMKEIDVALKLSPCGSDETAKAFIAEAKRLLDDPQVLGERLRECTAGRRLHPLAGRALQELELAK